MLLLFFFFFSFLLMVIVPCEVKNNIKSTSLPERAGCHLKNSGQGVPAVTLRMRVT